ncbi:MAG: virulence factor BrkB family protein [Candidatus Thiodiazotropha sp. (ex Dulcina madagascariensis)]|nr:virulence factor BrkB family protein [Candidatus Thiodiazotropha sp. (ex Dulcina madagascariensis)]MCU7925964.1 virulence factor BrkB family protein [Candidatus Thiodiazotropha sp. (ex Dulcina madagascariensis)]
MNQSAAIQTILSPLRHIRSFMRLLIHHFMKDGGVQHVAALTYTTLLSLVPLITVMLALFSVFPASERMSGQIENFLFENFVPAAGEAVQEHLRNFSRKAAQLTGVGFLFLILVALLLMSNIDKAFNTIWHVRRKRAPLAKFTVYWAILSLGPILIAMSVGATSYLVSMPFFDDAQAVVMVRSRLLGMMPVMISVLAFTLLYTLVPNRSVPLRHALAGGVVAALLFEISKRGFAFYVTTFPTYEAIYGALAVVPIFLIWIYLSWLVTLLGAEFTYCLGIYREDWRESLLPRGGRLLLAMKLLQRLRESQRRGDSLSTRRLQDEVDGVAEELLEEALMRLQQAGLVLRTEEKGWALARDLREVMLTDLYRSDAYVLPDKQQVERGSDALRRLIEKLNDDMRQTMDRSLEELL